jgi:hypothetical protein
MAPLLCSHVLGPLSWPTLGFKGTLMPMVGCSQTKGPIGGVVGLVFNKDQCWAILFFFFF